MRVLICAAATATLVACGGSPSSSSPSEPALETGNWAVSDDTPVKNGDPVAMSVAQDANTGAATATVYVIANEQCGGCALSTFEDAVAKGAYVSEEMEIAYDAAKGGWASPSDPSPTTVMGTKIQGVLTAGSCALTYPKGLVISLNGKTATVSDGYGSLGTFTMNQAGLDLFNNLMAGGASCPQLGR